MSNTIKYGTEIENNTLKKGNFVIGVNDVDYGPTSETGYHNTITPPEGGYVVYKNRGDNERSIYVAESDEELVLLKDDFGATGTTANDVLVWAAQQSDVIILNNPLDNIVTDGLVLYLDAGFTCSYPKANTTWYDLSGQGNNGTLTNGPTFDNGNGGSIVFDGVNDWVNCGNILDNLIDLSLECWVNFGSQNSNYNGLISKTLNNGNGWEIRTTSYTLSSTTVQFRYVGDNANTPGFILNNNTWHHILATGKYGEQKLYVNGKLENTVNYNRTPTANTNSLSIGKLAYTSLYLSGKMTGIKIYNRALTPQEILQNYNAQKSRFGL